MHEKKSQFIGLKITPHVVRPLGKIHALSIEVLYTDKCICTGNIWCVPVIRVNKLENIICQSYFGKDSLASFI